MPQLDGSDSEPQPTPHDATSRSPSGSRGTSAAATSTAPHGDSGEQPRFLLPDGGRIGERQTLSLAPELDVSGSERPTLRLSMLSPPARASVQERAHSEQPATAPDHGIPIPLPDTGYFAPRGTLSRSNTEQRTSPSVSPFVPADYADEKTPEAPRPRGKRQHAIGTQALRFASRDSVHTIHPEDDGEDDGDGDGHMRRASYLHTPIGDQPAGLGVSGVPELHPTLRRRFTQTRDGLMDIGRAFNPAANESENESDTETSGSVDTEKHMENLLNMHAANSPENPPSNNIAANNADITNTPDFYPINPSTLNPGTIHVNMSGDSAAKNIVDAILGAVGTSTGQHQQPTATTPAELEAGLGRGGRPTAHTTAHGLSQPGMFTQQQQQQQRANMMFPDLDHTGPMGLGRTPTTLRGVYANLSKLQSRMAEHQQKREQRMRDQQVREEKRREEQRKAEKRREDAEKRRDGKRRRDEATASNGEHPSRVQREHAVLSQVGARIRDIPEKLAAKHKSWYTTSPQPSQHSPQTADATPGTSQSPETKSNFIVHGSRQVPRPESVVMLLESMGSGGGSNGGGGSGGADGSSQPRQSSAPIAASHTQPRQSPAPIAASHTLPSMPGEYLAQFSSATGASPLSHSAAPSATTSPVPTPGWDEIMASCTVLSGHTTPLGIPGSRTSTASIDHTMLTFEAEKQKILAQLADIFNRQNFLLVASRALMAFGAPLHRLEANLIAVALNLDVQASFAALPGIILITFGDEDTRTSETYVVRSVSGYDMYRLGRTNRTIRRVLKGRITVGQGVKNIERVLATPPLYSWWILLIDYVVVSFCICPLFWNGSWRDAGVSAMLGLLIGVLQLMAGRFHNYANLFEVSSAFLVSFVAALMQGYVCFATVSFSGIAMLLPGLALTTSIIEMASRNMISGTVRLVFALCRCFMLGYGISVGSTLGTRVLGYASSVNLIEGQIGSDASVGLCLPGPSKFWWFLFLPMVSLGFNVSISAHWRQWPFMLIAGCLAYTVSYFASLSEALRPLAPAIAAFAMGLFANILASFYNHRSAVEPILGGVQLLVPGSLGLKTVLAFITSSDTGSGSFLYNMFATSLSIAVGLFLSGMVIFPNRKKRVGLMTF